MCWLLARCRMPELSEAEMIAYMQDWMNSHIDDSNYLNKPVMFTEFGKSSLTRGFHERQRDLFMAAVYDTIYESARKWGPASGALVWQLSTNSVMAGSQDGFAFVLSQVPTTASLMDKQSIRMGRLWLEHRTLTVESMVLGFKVKEGGFRGLEFF